MVMIIWFPYFITFSMLFTIHFRLLFLPLTLNANPGDTVTTDDTQRFLFYFQLRKPESQLKYQQTIFF